MPQRGRRPWTTRRRNGNNRITPPIPSVQDPPHDSPTIPDDVRERGDYDRHFFTYVIPPGEAGAGATVSITLLSEYLAHARVGSDPAVQEWRRCPPGIS